VQDRVGVSTRDDYQVRTAHEHGEFYLQRAQVRAFVSLLHAVQISLPAGFLARCSPYAIFSSAPPL
jgi:hypothetical protein